MEKRLHTERSFKVPSGLRVEHTPPDEAVNAYDFEGDRLNEVSTPEPVGLPDYAPADLAPDQDVIPWQKEPAPPALSPYQEELATTHVGLTIILARKFANRHGLQHMSEDLAQAACELLMRSVRNFNPELAPPSGFEGYLSNSVEGGLKRYLRDYGWVVRISRDNQSSLSNNPDDPDLENVRSARRPISLDTEHPQGGTRADMLADEQMPFDERFCDRQELLDALGHLSERNRRIVELYYFENMPQVDVAGEVGLCQMQVSRILRASLGTLAKLLSS
jgi:RNA polymerase sigma-B factor